MSLPNPATVRLDTVRPTTILALAIVTFVCSIRSAQSSAVQWWKGYAGTDATGDKVLAKLEWDSGASPSSGGNRRVTPLLMTLWISHHDSNE